MPSVTPIRKAVFPVAGLGTRFLPATKSIPKEMLPVVDKPLIQYAVEEAIEAGIDTLIFVTRGDKSAVTDHFARSEALERLLENRQELGLLEVVRAILPSHVRIRETLQREPLGLGHAVLCARDEVGDEPFAVILPDDMIHAPGQGALGQMIAAYQATGSSLLGVEEVPSHLTRRYGIAAVQDRGEGYLEVCSVVEKPEPEAAPSRLGIVGRYILAPEIFGFLEGLGAGAGGEIQLTDAIARLLEAHSVLAFPFSGRRYDCGSRLGFIQATIDLALQDEELRAELKQFLAEVET